MRGAENYLGLCGVALSAAVYGTAHHGGFPLLPRVAVALVLVAAAGAYAWRRRSPLFFKTPGTTFVIAFMSAALAVGVDGGLAGPSAETPWMVVDSLFFTAVSWTVVLWLPLEEGQEAPRVRSRWALPVLGLLAAVVLIGTSWVVVGSWHTTGDEGLYLQQAQWMRQPGFGFHADPALLEALPQHFRFVRGDRVITQYPPGWPAMLALANAVGMDRWLSPLLGALAALITCLLARRLAEERGADLPEATFVGILAGALLLTQHLFLETHVGFLSDPGTTAAVLLATWLLLGDGPLRWTAAGALVGVATAVRPVTGAALGGSLLLWAAIRAPKTAIRRVFFSAIGAAPFGVAIVLYNMATTGSPLEFGYHAVHGTGHDLGFGLRGFAGGIARPFTLTDGLVHTVARAHDIATVGVGLGLLLPLIALARATRARVGWVVVAVFMLLPLAHVFHFRTHTRFYVTLFPFLVIGVALLVRDVARSSGRLAALTAVAAMLIGNLAAAPVWQGRAFYRAPPALHRAVADVVRAAEHERVMVVVQRADAPQSNWFEQLYFRVGPDTAGRLLVIIGRHSSAPRDDSLRTLAAIASQKDRRVLTLTWCGLDSTYTLTPFDARQAAAATCFEARGANGAATAPGR